MCRLVYQHEDHFPLLVSLKDPKSANHYREVVFKKPEEIPAGACFRVLITRYEGRALQGV